MPLGITLTFLIASPMVNEVAVVLLFGMFGFTIAALYVGSGLLIAIVAGAVLGRMRLERYIEPFVLEVAGRAGPTAKGWTPSSVSSSSSARTEVKSIVGKAWPYLLVGIGLGAIVHGWAPTDFFARYAGPDSPLAVPFAVLMGIPLYSNAAGVMPLIAALHAKGLAMGTLLAFMMSVVALSLPELILLRRVLRPRLLACFVAVVAAGILATGFLYNAIL